MPNGFKKYLPVWLIAFIATVAIAWILPVKRTDLFYVIYYFVIAAFAIELCISYYAFTNVKDVAYPLFFYSIVGVVMIFVATYYIITKSLWVRPWEMAIIYIIILVLHYVLLILINISTKKNIERDEHVKNQTNIMLSLVDQVKTLYDSTSNEDIYRLYEALRYSDKALKNPEIEEQLSEAIKDLTENFDHESSKDKIDSIIALVKIR